MIDFIYRYMPIIPRDISILNSEELATLFHFPNKTVETHHIKWLNAKGAPAPSEIPNSGLRIGKSVYRGQEREIFMSTEDRRRHMYIIGKTGTGKSEFLKEMILQDIEAGYGVCAIDPHGEFVEDLMQLMPPERAEDVIYFNPSDLDRPMGMNVMEVDNEEQQYFVVNSIISLMYKLYDPHQTGIIGPRFEHAIRNAMLTIMCKKGTTFIELVRILTDPKYVDEMLPMLKTRLLNVTGPIKLPKRLTSISPKFWTTSFLSLVSLLPTKRCVTLLVNRKAHLTCAKFMDEQKIFLANLSKGVFGRRRC